MKIQIHDNNYILNLIYSSRCKCIQIYATYGSKYIQSNIFKENRSPSIVENQVGAVVETNRGDGTTARTPRGKWREPKRGEREREREIPGCWCLRDTCEYPSDESEEMERANLLEERSSVNENENRCIIPALHGLSQSYNPFRNRL